MKYNYLCVRNLQVHLYNIWIKRNEVRSIALMKQPKNQRKTHHLKAFVTQFLRDKTNFLRFYYGTGRHEQEWTINSKPYVINISYLF